MRGDQDLYLMVHVKDGKPSSPVKVGISGNVSSRLASLQSGNPSRITVYETWDLHGAGNAAFYMEQAFHTLQSESRLQGEWFDMDPEKARQIIELYFNVLFAEYAGGVHPKPFYFGRNALAGAFDGTHQND